MNDKVCIVTGATSGIGATAAEELAGTGATVVVVGRNREKCTTTVEHIRHKTVNPSVDYLVADLSSQSEIQLDDLQGRSRYRGFPAYGQSKLANLLITCDLARRLEGTSVTVNALHPGVVATNIAKNNFRTWHLLKPLYDFYHGLK